MLRAGESCILVKMNVLAANLYALYPEIATLKITSIKSCLLGKKEFSEGKQREGKENKGNKMKWLEAGEGREVNGLLFLEELLNK